MTKNEKRLLINGILLPIFTAIILSVLYVGIINALTPDKGFQMAAEQGKQVNEITSFDIKEENGNIKKSSFNKLENNSVIGTISVGDESLPLITRQIKSMQTKDLTLILAHRFRVKSAPALQKFTKITVQKSNLQARVTQ